MRVLGESGYVPALGKSVIPTLPKRWDDSRLESNLGRHRASCACGCMW